MEKRVPFSSFIVNMNRKPKITKQHFAPWLYICRIISRNCQFLKVAKNSSKNKTKSSSSTKKLMIYLKGMSFLMIHKSDQQMNLYNFKRGNSLLLSVPQKNGGNRTHPMEHAQMIS